VGGSGKERGKPRIVVYSTSTVQYTGKQWDVVVERKTAWRWMHLSSTVHERKSPLHSEEHCTQPLPQRQARERPAASTRSRERWSHHPRSWHQERVSSSALTVAKGLTTVGKLATNECIPAALTRTYGMGALTTLGKLASSVDRASPFRPRSPPVSRPAVTGAASCCWARRTERPAPLRCHRPLASCSSP